MDQQNPTRPSTLVVYQHQIRGAKFTPRLLSTKQAMFELSIGRTKFYELIASDKLKTVRIGRRRYVTDDAMNEFIGGLTV
jgi:excisionase family DNA binding protein